MPLHPLAQAFLDLPSVAEAKPFCSMTAEECRRVSAEMFSFGPPGEPVGSVDDLRVPGPGGGIPIRVCYEGMLHMVQGPEALNDMASYLRQAFAASRMLKSEGESECSS
jgi:hypothetical protein